MVKVALPIEHCESSTEAPSGVLLDSDLVVNGQSIPRQRILGAYYTPEGVAEDLVRWALNSAPGRILDPSFGGCAFMEAGAKVLEELGSESVGEQVFGVDVDPSCVQYVRDSERLRESNCIFEDFLALTPYRLEGTPFRAIVGNPPYVRHHWVKNQNRIAARRIAAECSVTLPETASLWAYFVLRATAFLEPGGRLALLVPEAILQADYAAAVRAALKTSFRRVRLIHLRERLFNDTKEPVVVVAGEGFGVAGSIEVHSVDTAGQLRELLQTSVSAFRRRSAKNAQQTLKNGRRVSSKALAAMAQVELTRGTSELAGIATTRIGIVTGANSHFIRTESDLRHLDVPSRARHGIVSRTKWLAGIDFTTEDHEHVAMSGERAYLVRPSPDLEHLPGVRRWIEEGEAAGVDTHHKCEKRDPWFRVDLPTRPDAFLTSTRLGPPRLVINRTDLCCTNTLYAVRFKLPKGVQPECIALGFLTTYVALWAELHGRRYGGGALKLDLSALARLPVPIVPSSIHDFVAVNEALRAGREHRAREMADRAVLQEGLGIEKATLNDMRTALRDLARQRVPDEKESCLGEVYG